MGSPDRPPQILHETPAATTTARHHLPPEDICGEPAAAGRIECHETAAGVECDYPTTGVPWDLYDDEGSACTGGKWGSEWCDAVFE